MRSVLFALALLLPSAAAAQPLPPCEPVGAQELLDCLNGRIARLEALLTAGAPSTGLPMGGPLVGAGPTLCAVWQRDGEGFRCTLYRRASYSR